MTRVRTRDPSTGGNDSRDHHPPPPPPYSDPHPPWFLRSTGTVTETETGTGRTTRMSLPPLPPVVKGRTGTSETGLARGLDTPHTSGSVTESEVTILDTSDVSEEVHSGGGSERGHLSLPLLRSTKVLPSGT